MPRRVRRNSPLFPAIENIINEFAHTPLPEVANRTITLSKPKANIITLDENYEIQLALPGLTKDQIEIKVEANELKISSKPQEQSETTFKLKEFDFSNFERKFILPDNIDKTKIDAAFENGILNISLFKAEEAKPKNIEIK